jgi:hypothetical protein
VSYYVWLAGLWLVVTGAIGCVANDGNVAEGQDVVVEESDGRRETTSEAIAQEKVSEVTASIGNQAELQNQARQAAGVLKQLDGLILQSPNAKPEAVSSLTRDIAELSTDFDAIADCHNSREFTAAVFDMCEPEPVQASARLGPWLIAFGARMGAKPPPKVPAGQVAAWAQYFGSLGETLIRIPRRCRDVRKSIAQEEAAAKAQEQAADVQAKRRREASLMLLCLSGGMAAPSPNRYPMNAMAKLGSALQGCQ